MSDLLRISEPCLAHENRNLSLKVFSHLLRMVKSASQETIAVIGSGGHIQFPPAGGPRHDDQLLDSHAQSPGANPFVGPDQAALQEMLA